MKNGVQLIGLLLLVLSLINLSCKKEEFEFIGTPPEQALPPDSNVANLLQRISLKDGSDDNIIDGANCLTLVLPVTVTVNGTVVVVETPNDFDTIEDIFELMDDDNDTLEITFPIAVTLNDFTELTVSDQNELDALAQACGPENQEDDDIECVDIKYPFGASLFNPNSELTSTISIQNDQMLYNFILDLDPEDIVSIDFPIIVILNDRTEKEVFGLVELESIIENAKDSCDEDDDNDFDDDDCDDCTTSQLTDVLVDCPDWRVDKLERNDQDLEDNYTDYLISFENDGTLTALFNTNSFAGTWETNGSGNNISVTINIPSLPDFNATWNLNEIEQDQNESKVDLRMGDDRLRFKSDCVSNNDVDDSALVQVLTTGDWYVTNYFDDGDETALFDGLVFNFALDGSATASETGTTTNGSWTTNMGNETNVELNLNFGTNPPFDQLLEDWDVLEANDNIIRLKDISGGTDDIDFLTFRRNPIDNGNTSSDLSTVIIDGIWTVSSYRDNGTDQTTDYAGFTFDFNSNGTVIASNGGTTNGTWAAQNGDNQLTLDFGNTIPLNEFNDDWDVILATETVIRLSDVSGGNGDIDMLVFTKQ
ncbi:hypothetical protein FK220_014285 [Flavobacteriaceae bacterium TP-CH-4]|uniref:Lipocalin-like domain-containing protein n=1 Tax=Pelagihabitans pacificus TaxID=2696054 RepID=A0A967AWP0_9FLAO|nr:hypothetical protein [Pelagihabitans pacificus]NHF60520.1 hypothetical protein [Pelagihabitans pacificus]